MDLVLGDEFSVLLFSNLIMRQGEQPGSMWQNMLH